MKTKKMFSMLLALCLLLALLPTAAFATGTGKAIRLVDKSGAAPAAGNIAGAQASNIYFGTYPQSSDGNGGYNDDPIKWRVLQNADGHLLLLSDQNLDAVQYNTNRTSVTWETSTIRSWLNGYGSAVNQAGTDYSVSPAASFLGTAFTTGEQAAIPAVTVVNDNNPEYGTAGGNNTTDKLFLLSIAEATTTGFGFTDNYSDTDVRKAGNTDYAKSRGVCTYSSTGCGDWWLRSPGDNADYVAFVNFGGYVVDDGYRVDISDVGVRPAFHIDLNSVLFTSAAAGGKEGDGLFAVPTTDATDWKLTLLDAARSDFTASFDSAFGDVWTIKYSGAKNGTNEYISALVVNSSGEVTYYGRLAEAQSGDDKTVTVDLEGKYNDGDTLYVFNEQYNGDYMTDFASAFAVIVKPTTLDVVGLTEWNDAGNESERPEKITVRLLAGGVEKASQEVSAGEYGLWAFSFDNLPIRDAQGQEIAYSVTADEIPSYTTVVESPSANTFRIVNTAGTAVTEVSTWEGLQAALSAGGDIVLTADVTPDNPYWADALVVNSGVLAALDLNGHTVDRGYTEQGFDGSVIKIYGTLTVTDSASGGNITGGFPDQYGGGVQILGGTFNLLGGSITGNSVGKTGFFGTEGLGGGVYLQSGTFNMSGGAISSNKALGSSMGDSLGRGGGVYISGGAFHFTGGTISGNDAGAIGGGVYLASTYSGHDGTINVSGDATVTDNTVGGAANNVYLEDGGVLSVTDTLTGTIGVTMQTPGVFTNGLSGRGTKENFKSDDAGYIVSLTDASEAQLEVKPTFSVTITPGANMTKTSDSGEATQAGLVGAMTDVVYEADENYYFPTDYASVGTTTGVTVTRDNFTQITVSGTPTADTAINLAAATAKMKEDKPTATFTATGPDSGTLTGVTAGMTYAIDGGAAVEITGTSVDLTGLAPCTITVIQPGNGMTTIDSEVQTITVTKAETPCLTATQPAVINGTGSIPTTAAYEFSEDGTNWADCTGETSGLAAGTYFVRVKAAGTVLASEAQSITITAFVPTQEPTPTATFTATGADTGTLSNVTAGMTYAIDGGAAVEITGKSVDLTGLAPCTITVIQPGNGTTTVDSEAQSIPVTKAATPTLIAIQPSAIGGTGSIPTTAEHEFSEDGTSWTACTGETSGLAAGTYFVRVKAAGTVLASDAQEITITAFVPTQEPTPTATFTATGPDSGTLTNVTAGMTYAIDGGAEVEITGTSVDLTGLAPCTITVIQPGNGTTTVDSEAQTIPVTKAATPSLTATQPAVINGTGSIPTTAAYEFSEDGTNWADCTGETSGLAARTYFVRVKAAGTVLASDAQSITVTAFVPTQELTPNAVFTATGPDSGTLTGVTAGMTYAIDGGAAAEITGTTVDLTGLAPCIITVIQPGNGTTTIDSEAQNITVTKAATPSLTATQPDTIGGTGSIPTTAAHEISEDGTSWTACTGETTGLAAETYYVRVKAAGTVLASDAQSITVTAFDPAQEPTPTATFTATGADTGTLSNVTAGMTYAIDGGAAVEITGTSVDLTGLAPCAITVIQPGNGTTTVDSEAQTIPVTKAATPDSVTAEDCTTYANNNGKLIGVTAAMDYKKADTDAWTSGTGDDVTGLVPGDYLVRAAASGTALASDAQALTVGAYVAPPYYEPALVTEVSSGATITSAELDRLIREGKTLTVEAEDGTKVELSNDALRDIAGQASGSIRFDLTKETPSGTGGTGETDARTAYALTVSADGKTVDFDGKVGMISAGSADASSAPVRTASITAPDGIRHFVVSGEPFPYTDVPAGSYYYDAVNWADLLGITEGTAPDLFNPNGSCTRAQMVTFLWRAAGQPEPTATGNPFSDLDEDAYYYKAVLWAAENGITVGTGDGKFDPDGTVTRAQSVTFLFRALHGSAAAGSGFADVNPDAYYYAAVLWAAENGITLGTDDGKFSPDDDCLRAQIVTFLYRAYSEK